VFVSRPQLHPRLGEGRAHRSYERPELFLNAACCSGLATA
jgi:hypothetical protein